MPKKPFTARAADLILRREMSDFLIANRDRRALPLVVRENLEALMRSGHFPPGSQLPSEDVLAEQLAVSRPTLREALRALALEGLVWRRRGVGTFVARRPTLANSLNENFGVSDLIRRQQREPGCRHIEIKETKADKELARQLQVPFGAALYEVERLRTADDVPVVFSIDVFARALLPDSPLILKGQSIYRLLEEAGRRIHYGVARVVPTAAGPSLAEKLDVAADSPLLLLEQIDYGADDKPLLHSLEWHVSDAFDIEVYRKGPHETG
jgi:GntR family transcriptional regulator